MKTSILKLAAATGMTAILAGCVNPDGTQNYTGSGALIGAGSGALIGAAAAGPRNGPAGALIGGVAGLLTGTLIGNSMDQEASADRYRAAVAATPPPPPQPMTQPPSIADIKAMSKSGVSDDVIINQIRSSRAIYHLSADTIIDLKNSGISPYLLNFMINTPSTAPNEPVSAPTTPPPAPQTEAQPPAPGPDYVWVNGDYTWVGGRWVWGPGYWVLPPTPGVIWVGGGWVHGPYGWHHERGHWR